MSKESRAIAELVELGYSRREANHLVNDKGWSSGKFKAARAQGIKKQSARQAAKNAKVGRVDAEKPRRSWFGGRARNNFREY